MKELIDKAELLEELKKCEKICENYMLSHKDAISQGIANAKRAMCQHIIKIINTLEVKEVGVDLGDPKGDKSAKYIIDTKTLEVKEVDLEKEYEEFVVDDPILGNFITNDTMGMVLAKYFFELGINSKGE